MSIGNILLMILCINTSLITIVLGKIAYGSNATGKHKDNRF